MLLKAAANMLLFCVSSCVPCRRARLDGSCSFRLILKILLRRHELRTLPPQILEGASVHVLRVKVFLQVLPMQL
jgi:hypothetical protein